MSPLPADLFDVQPTLVNPNATENARCLMTFLCDSYGKKIISGQQCQEGPFGLSVAGVWRGIGGKDYPAVLGMDLLSYSPSRMEKGDNTSKVTDYAIEYWNQGGITTLCWRWCPDSRYDKGKDIWGTFYTENTNFNLAKALGGQDEEGYQLLLRDIDAIAVELGKMQDAGVPILFRPLHEASGGWFWWGTSGPDAYLELYKLLYDRLTNVHGLNNLIWVWNGQDAAWYLQRSNPKGATAVLDESFIAGAGNMIVISKETDNAQTKLGTPVAFYLDNIRFLDADGKELALDTTAVYKDATKEADLSNLLYLTDVVEFADTANAGAWSQADLASSADIIAALEPGKVVEIAFESKSGDMWLVFPDSAVGWMRVGNDGKAFINDSKNIAQVTYEMIAAALGEDKTAWGARVQAEASDEWKVYSIKVGTANPVVSLGEDAVEYGDTATAGAWSQADLASSADIMAALEPGKAIAITFESEDNTMWAVFPDSAAGWTRVGNDGKATIQGGVAYVPYEMVVETLGEDKAAWGARVQAEGASAWSVYNVSVGTLVTSDPRQAE